MSKKTSTFIIILGVLIMILFPFLTEYTYVFEDLSLNPFDYARITDVDYKAVVVDEQDGRGKVVITERLTFDIHAASKDNLFWELWRDLPEDYVDGLKVDYTLNSVKQIMDDGSEVIYEKSPKLYWDDHDYVSYNAIYGPGKWFHSKGPYDESSRRYECVFFYVDGLYREKVTFEIEYEMHNAALRYNDCSDLYLALYSGSTIRHLDSFKAQILFPEKEMPSQGNYEVYTYGTNSNEFPVTESASLNPGYYTFSFELDKEDLKFKPYNQYIEFDLVSYNEDKHIFTEYAPSNMYSYDNVLDEIYEEQRAYASAPERFQAIKFIILAVSIILGVLILLWTLTAEKRLKKKHIFYEPSIQADYFREIPSDLDPNFAASLVFCKQKQPKDNSGVYSAILLSLARKKYIKLEEEGYDNTRITILYNPALQQSVNSFSDPVFFVPLQNHDISSGFTSDFTPVMSPEIEIEPETYEPLTPCEEYYFNLLNRHKIGDSILMSLLQQKIGADYENTEAFTRNIKRSVLNIGVNEGYFQKSNYDQPKKSLQTAGKTLGITGVLLLTIVNLISSCTRLDLAFGAYVILGISFIISSRYLKKKSGKFILLTQFGEDEYVKWRGLYNFLNSETLMNERTYVELPIWEKYLVYATAFGISEKVIQAISIRCPETEASPVLHGNYHRSRSFRHSGHSFRSGVRTASRGSFSGGGGGGFGYGGGGRGGGGGGGGH